MHEIRYLVYDDKNQGRCCGCLGMDLSGRWGREAAQLVGI